MKKDTTPFSVPIRGHMHQDTAPDVSEYFDHVVRKYNCGDVSLLLAIELQACGPLLASAMNGIDCLGGMMLGFDEGSRKRSIAFMERYLALTTSVADAIYSLARCGLVHEGVTKGPVLFFVRYSSTRPEHFFFNDYDVIAVDVTELARRYLEAVDQIGINPAIHLSHVPHLIPRDLYVRESVPYEAMGSIAELKAYVPDGELIMTGSGGPYLYGWLKEQPELAAIFLPGKP